MSATGVDSLAPCVKAWRRLKPKAVCGRVPFWHERLALMPHALPRAWPDVQVAAASDFRDRASAGRRSNWLTTGCAARLLAVVVSGAWGVAQAQTAVPSTEQKSILGGLVEAAAAASAPQAESVGDLGLRLGAVNPSSNDLPLSPTSTSKDKAAPQAGYQPFADLLRPCRQDSFAAALLEAGRVAEAQQVLQLAKECELHHALGESLTIDPRITPLPIRPSEQTLVESSARLDQELESLTHEREQLLSRPPQDGKSNRLELDALEERFKLLAQRKKELVTTVQRNGQAAETPAKSSRLQQAVSEVFQSEPGAHAIGLQYLVQENGVWILLMKGTAAPQKTFVEVPRSQLERVVRTVRLQLRQPSSDLALVQGNLGQLHQWLLSPVQDQLGDARTLMVSTTGVLRYVPFAALYEQGRYLVERFSVAAFNEAVETHLDSRTPPQWRVTAMGMSQSVGELRPLVAVPDEMRGVIRQPNTRGVAYLDGDFNMQRLRTVLDSRVTSNILHIASHFVLEPRRASDSRLYLGDGSELSLRDLALGRLRFDPFDLVTLSACETAMPGETDIVTGQEVESLGAYAQQQGAKAVMATLWKVNDRSTAAFMEGFYRQRGTRQTDKASALRFAQLSFVQGQRATGGQSGQDWSHPFYWAPFVLMGNWR